MFIRISSLFFLSGVIFCPPLLAGVSTSSVDSVQRLTLRGTDEYDVVCKDGSREIATLKQIESDDVCKGNDVPVPSNGIVAMFSDEKLGFYVLCQDATWQIATSGDITNGKVCVGTKKALLGSWSTQLDSNCDGVPDYSFRNALIVHADGTADWFNLKMTWAPGSAVNEYRFNFTDARYADYYVTLAMSSRDGFTAVQTGPGTSCHIGKRQ